MSKPATKRLRSSKTKAPESYSRQEFENDQMGQSGQDISEQWLLRAALRDLLDLYDRHVHGKTTRAAHVPGKGSVGSKENKSSESWGVDEVLRLNEIRALAGVK